MLTMKRLLLSLAGLSLISGLATAQMSDVPQTHWAYDAIEQLVRMGIIQGYPDGTFKPRRTMTRAEFAEAMARAYSSLDEKIRALNGRVDELQRQIANINTGGGGTDQGLADRVQKLETAVQELNRLNEAVATLNRLAQTFQQELASQGVDINALKQRVADLETRIRGMGPTTDKVKLSGDLTFGAFGTHSFEGRSAITSRGQFIHPSGKLLQSTEVLHELGLGVDVAISDDVMGKGTFIISNYLPYVGMANRGAFSMAPGPALAPGNTTVTIWEAYVKAPIDLFGNKVNLAVGRMPIMGSRYTLHSIDPDNYLDFARYNDGMFRVDGAGLSFDFGTVQLQLGAGRTRTVADTNGMNFSNLIYGNHNTMGPAADQVAGARLNIAAIRGGEEDEGGNSLTIGATYFAAGVPNTVAPAGTAGIYNRVDVLGVDLHAMFSGFKVYAEYAQSQLYNDDTSILNKENWALDANVGYAIANNLNLKVGYREIRPRFMAPGSWGRIGFLYNPSDIKGFYAKANYNVSEDFGIMVGGEFYEGTGRLSVANGGYQTNDKVNRLLAGIDYKLSERWNVSLDYEGVFWRPRSATFGSPSTSPVWNYFTLGVGYNMGENTTLNVLYQILDYDGKGVAALSGGPSSGKNRGGVAATTLSVKF